MDLILHLKGEYFDQIKSGEKQEEFRFANTYWRKRLLGRRYSRILFMRGYPKRGDFERIEVRPWRGASLKTITHPHFGPDPAEVIAIIANEPKGATNGS